MLAFAQNCSGNGNFLGLPEVSPQNGKFMCAKSLYRLGDAAAEVPDPFQGSVLRQGQRNHGASCVTAHRINVRNILGNGFPPDVIGSVL